MNLQGRAPLGKKPAFLGNLFKYIMTIGGGPLFASVLLASCATPKPPEPIVVTKEVRIEVPIPCIVGMSRPTIPDPDAAIRATHEPGELELLMANGRLVRSGWINELEAAVINCGGTIK